MYQVWTEPELKPVMGWVPAVLLQGGSWYHLARISDRDVLSIHIIVHGTSGALAYHDCTIMSPEIITVSTVSLFDIVEKGYHEQWSVSMDCCEFRFRHYLRRQIDADSWLDTRKLRHVHHDVGRWCAGYDA